MITLFVALACALLAVASLMAAVSASRRSTRAAIDALQRVVRPPGVSGGVIAVSVPSGIATTLRARTEALGLAHPHDPRAVLRELVPDGAEVLDHHHGVVAETTKAAAAWLGETAAALAREGPALSTIRRRDVVVVLYTSEAGVLGGTRSRQAVENLLHHASGVAFVVPPVRRRRGRAAMRLALGAGFLVAIAALSASASLAESYRTFARDGGGK